MEEKVAILRAQSKFSSPGVPRLGYSGILDYGRSSPVIGPEVLWDEWNQAGWTNDSCVAFPALTCLAATWNPEMSMLYGKSIGEEARYRNKTVLLGPGVNIYRTPLNGRNFEYMGEDPYLASRMVVPYVQGVHQSVDFQSGKQIFASLEITGKGTYQQAFAKTAWTAQEISLALCYQVVNQTGLIHIYIAIFTDLVKTLYSNRVFHILLRF